MIVQQVMTHSVGGIQRHDSLQEAAQTMRTMGTGCLPVLDGEVPVGIITDRDLVLRAVARGLDPQTPIEQVMTEQPLFCLEEADLEVAATQMQLHQIRRLLVKNTEHKLIGILTLGDLAVRGDDIAQTARTLECVSVRATTLYGPVD